MMQDSGFLVKKEADDNGKAGYELPDRILVSAVSDEMGRRPF